jgi:hypothetical protein
MRRLLTLVLVLGVAAAARRGHARRAGNTAASAGAQPHRDAQRLRAACGTPLPPFEFAYGLESRQLEPSNNKKILNASPAIRNLEHCAAAGFENTLICNTRKEGTSSGHPATITSPASPSRGAWGRTGSRTPDPEGPERLVRCGETDTTCALKPEDQYLLDIYEVGRYVACGGVGGTSTCGDCIILTMARSGGSLGGLCKHS